MVQDMRPEHGRRAGRIRARFVFTLIGAAALVVGAFLDWTASLAGNKLTLRSLVENDFNTRSNVLHTVAAVSVLIAIVAVLSLLDPTGWLTRLTGLAGVVLFVMFAIQLYRHNGQNFGPAVDALRPGAWLQLGGGVALLVGGLVRYRRRRGRAAPVAGETIIATKAPDSASATAPEPERPSAEAEPEPEPVREPEPARTAPAPDSADSADSESERERLQPETTVFRPPTAS